MALNTDLIPEGSIALTPYIDEDGMQRERTVVGTGGAFRSVADQILEAETKALEEMASVGAVETLKFGNFIQRIDGRISPEAEEKLLSTPGAFVTADENRNFTLNDEGAIIQRSETASDSSPWLTYDEAGSVSPEDLVGVIHPSNAAELMTASTESIPVPTTGAAITAAVNDLRERQYNEALRTHINKWSSAYRSFADYCKPTTNGSKVVYTKPLGEQKKLDPLTGLEVKQNAEVSPVWRNGMKKLGLLSLIGQLKVQAENKEITTMTMMELIKLLTEYINDEQVTKAIDEIPF